MHLQPPLRSVLALVVAASPAGALQAVQPFAPGPRWEHAPDPQTPWIPRDVALFAGDELVAAGLAHGSPRVGLFGGQHEPGGALLALDNASFAAAPEVIATAGVGNAAFFAAGLPSGSEFRVRVARQGGAAGPAWAADWTVDLGGTGQSGARLAAAAGGLVVAQPLTAPPRVRVSALDPTDGALRWEVELAGATLRGLDLTADASRVLVLAGSDLHVLDGVGGLVLYHRFDPDPARSAALSGDGARIALGFGAQVEVLSDPALDGSFAVDQLLAGGAMEFPVAVDLDRDGDFLAVGWWDGLGGRTVRLETWDLAAAPLRLNHLPVVGPPFGPQNYVAEARVTSDGRRAAFGLWGLGTGDPEVVLFDRSSTAPVLSESLSGSVYAIDLSDDGTRLAVARKEGHANVLGTLGAVELVDTGERDLELSASAVAGTTVDAWLAAPGALSAGLLLGAPIPRPAPLHGVGGLLGIDATAPWTVVPALATAPGVFVAQLTVPPAAAGLEVALQGILVETGPSGPVARFSTSVAQPPLF